MSCAAPILKMAATCRSRVFNPIPGIANNKASVRAPRLQRRSRAGWKQTCDRGRIPLLLGGDCIISLGVISGLLRGMPDDLGLLYVDGDIQHPCHDGMGIAHVIGLADNSLSAIAVNRKVPIMGSYQRPVTFSGMEMAHDEATLMDATFHRPRTGEGFSPAVVLVEGISDQLALEALAMRRGRNLDAERISIVPIGGATNIASFLDLIGPHGLDVRLAGLCDAGEEGTFKRGLERAGIGSNLTRAGMEILGFHVCVADLEDELIRSLGLTAVEQVIRAQGELGLFRIFQKQPAWRGRTNEEQLRRFFGTHKGRKIQSASLLVGALDLNRVPRPLDGVLAHV